MHELKEPLTDLINERYGNVTKFARRVGIASSTMHHSLENGLVGSALSTIAPALRELKLDPLALAAGNIVPLVTERDTELTAPLFGSISAGEPKEALVTDARFPIPAELHEEFPHAFFLRVSGESMNRVLPNGCYALVDPCSAVERPGKPYAVAVGVSDVTVKCVRPLENGVELVPDSHDPTFRPKLYDFGDPTTDNVRIIGRVVWFAMPLDWHRAM